MSFMDKAIVGLFAAIIAAIVGMGIYSHIQLTRLALRMDDLSSHISVLETSFSSTTELLQKTIDKNYTTFNSALNQNVGVLNQKLGTYQQQVGSINTTVSTLQKLSKTDPELLAKYSKVFFLNENYVPERLAEIPADYKYSATKAVSINASVWPYLQKLLDQAKKDGVDLYVLSGYRSFSEQKALKGEYTVIYGAGTANQFSADQGYSEHQLGTTLDFMTSGLGGALDNRFEKTSAFAWLQANAYKYGFILSYPKDNNFYVYEPWHWRFVGTKLASDLHNSGKNFYDMDQRDIDAYLVNIFD